MKKDLDIQVELDAISNLKNKEISKEDLLLTLENYRKSIQEKIDKEISIFDKNYENLISEHIVKLNITMEEFNNLSSNELVKLIRTR
jgi:hypothetical protein